MAANFMKIASTDSVLKAQEHYFGSVRPATDTGGKDILSPDEVLFIQSRDSFYMASVNSDGWPYIQHRGGKPGFLRVSGPDSLAFADYKGNRQLLTIGNISDNDRVSLFLMDYPQRSRLKIMGHARVVDARKDPELVQQVADIDEQKLVERVFVIDVIGYDWNCPKYITPRYTAAEVQAAIEPMKDRIADLEAQLKALKAEGSVSEDRSDPGSSL